MSKDGKINYDKGDLSESDANLIRSSGISDDGHNYQKLYNSSDIRPSDVESANNIANAINNDDTGRSFWANDIGTLTVKSVGGKLYIEESDTFSANDRLELRVEPVYNFKTKTYDRVVQVYGDLGQLGSTWINLEDLKGDATSLRTLFEGAVSL